MTTSLRDRVEQLVREGWTYSPCLLYDEEGVEGFRWDGPDGEELAAVGCHDCLPELPDELAARFDEADDFVPFVCYRVMADGTTHKIKLSPRIVLGGQDVPADNSDLAWRLAEARYCSRFYGMMGSPCSHWIGHVRGWCVEWHFVPAV